VLAPGAWASFITHGVLPLLTKMLTFGLFFFLFAALVKNILNILF
jgi:hypothetical protein